MEPATAAKTLSDKVRQIDNAFGNKEVNRRAALAATEDDHFADGSQMGRAQRQTTFAQFIRLT